MSARVVRVVDGDTVHVVLADDSYIVCRLIGIDAPEQGWADRGAGTKPGQPLAHAATEYLTYVLRGAIRVTFHGEDVYNRSLCGIEDSRGLVNGEMVRAGFAEVYRGPGENPYRDQLEAFEQEARSAQRGIWRLPDYQSPRGYRRSTPGTEAPR